MTVNSNHLAQYCKLAHFWSQSHRENDLMQAFLIKEGSWYSLFGSYVNKTTWILTPSQMYDVLTYTPPALSINTTFAGKNFPFDCRDEFYLVQ